MLQVKTIFPGRRIPQVGLGTIHFGRPWPMDKFNKTNFRFPTIDEVRSQVHTAHLAGVRMIDTAHAYGLSEVMLGRVFNGNPEIREKCLIATKGGETWDLEREQSEFDNSLGALQANLAESRRLLGRVDIFYFHAPHIGDGEVLRSAEIQDALTAEIEDGRLKYIGVSVEQMDLLRRLREEGNLWPQVVQVPASFVFGPGRDFKFIDSLRTEDGKIIVVNRPYQNRPAGWSAQDAHQFFLKTQFMVLTGARDHLDENLEYFKEEK